MKKQLIETGKIVGTHGIKGEIRFNPWSDSPEFILKFKTLYIDENTKLNIKGARVHGNVVLLTIDGVNSINEAERYRGKVLYINRKDVKLREGDYFIQDLIGLKVFDVNTNEYYGDITDVSKTGANDVWHIKKDAKEFLIPSIPHVVITVDIENEKVLIDPLEGLFDED